METGYQNCSHEVAQVSISGNAAKKAFNGTLCQQDQRSATPTIGTSRNTTAPSILPISMAMDRPSCSHVPRVASVCGSATKPVINGAPCQQAQCSVTLAVGISRNTTTPSNVVMWMEMGCQSCSHAESVAFACG